MLLHSSEAMKKKKKDFSGWWHGWNIKYKNVFEWPDATPTESLNVCKKSIQAPKQKQTCIYRQKAFQYKRSTWMNCKILKSWIAVCVFIHTTCKKWWSWPSQLTASMAKENLIYSPRKTKYSWFKCFFMPWIKAQAWTLSNDAYWIFRLILELHLSQIMQGPCWNAQKLDCHTWFT